MPSMCTVRKCRTPKSHVDSRHIGFGAQGKGGWVGGGGGQPDVWFLRSHIGDMLHNHHTVPVTLSGRSALGHTE